MKEIHISGSKSESNRLLVLQKLFGGIEIKNISDAQDTQLLQKALHTDQEVINIHHAGTAMRFLTSYFAIQEGRTTILTGSDRMKQRPIAPLVTALKNLGADIEYMEVEGYPPLKIRGKKLEKNKVSISSNISSQFITSLILIAGKLPQGLHIQLEGKITSRPYLEMSLALLKDLTNASPIYFNEQNLYIPPLTSTQHKTYIVESDWSSASYFYSYVALSKKPVKLSNFKEKSLQGDSILIEIYRKFFGVETIFNTQEESISLLPIVDFKYPERIELDMNSCPDIAQTVCVTATALKIPFDIKGLSTLKVKETDRLKALHNELKKIGCNTEISDEHIASLHFGTAQQNIRIATYNDHRMAMAFAPFSLLYPIDIEHPEVVEKSYPNFWKDWKNLCLSSIN